MKLKLTATLEVIEKYHPQVARDFEAFINGLPARVGGLEVGECNAESVPQSDAKHKNAKGKGSPNGGKGKGG